MSKTTIEREWAWTQVEAMADGTLEGGDLERMRRALSEDKELRAAVETARVVLGGLRRAGVPAPPAGLLRRLLAQGGRHRRRPRATGAKRSQRGWLIAPLGVASTALIALLFGSMLERMSGQAEQDAVRDFAIAMTYLRESAVVTSEQVGQQLGEGLMTALATSRETLAGDEQADDQNGG